MAKGLAALISVLGAAGTGYMRGKQMYEQGERQKVRDAREDEEYEFRKGERTEAQKLKADLAAANADQAPEAIPSYDISKIDGGDPATQPTVGYAAAGQTFADQAGAQQALHGVNSRAEKAARTAKVLQASGNPAHLEQATKWDALAKQAIEEGSDKLIGAITSTQPHVDALKKAGGRIAGTVGQAGADAFNSIGGNWKVRADTVVEHYLDKDAVGREFANSRVLDKDGKPVIEDLRTANLMLADYKTRLQVQQNDQAAHQRSVEMADTKAYRDSEAKERNRHNRATEGIQYAEAAARRAREERDSKSLRAQTPAGQIEAIEEATGVKLTPEEKKAYFKIGKAGAGKGDELTTKIVEKAVENFHVNNPNATTGQLATFRANLEADMGAAKNNIIIANTLRDEFAKAPPGSPEYAATYADAKADLRMTDADLAKMGYAPPAAAPAPAARRAASGVTPARSAPQGVDVRSDPTLVALNAGIAKLDPKDPRNVDQLMKLGTAKNARIQQLQANQGSGTQLITE